MTTVPPFRWTADHVEFRRVTGGASEIQRTIIGERILGLPRDRDPYDDQPFEERPHG